MKRGFKVVLAAVAVVATALVVGLTVSIWQAEEQAAAERLAAERGRTGQ